MSENKLKVTLHMVNEAISALEFAIMLIATENPLVAQQHTEDIVRLVELKEKIQNGEVFFV